MDLISLGIVAAAGLGGLVVARLVTRRRRAALPAPPDERGADDPPTCPNPTDGLPVGLRHVIQVEDDTRWPRSGVLVHHDGRLHGAILLTTEGDQEQATLTLAPPSRHLYWLARRKIAMPPKPPARIEVDGLILERAISFPAKLTTIGEAPPAVGDQGTFCLYDGSVGDGALVLVAEETFIWYGRRLAEDEWESLGEVEPED